jgi:alkylation response protein AidB-like acyl-CoA dehydrogenase
MQFAVTRRGESLPGGSARLAARQLRRAASVRTKVRACAEFDLAWQRRQSRRRLGRHRWPVEYGGRGLSATQQLIWYEECARAGVPVGGSTFVALNHAGPTLMIPRHRPQKALHLPRILRGE